VIDSLATDLPGIDLLGIDLPVTDLLVTELPDMSYRSSLPSWISLQAVLQMSKEESRG